MTAFSSIQIQQVTRGQLTCCLLYQSLSNLAMINHVYSFFSLLHVSMELSIYELLIHYLHTSYSLVNYIFLEFQGIKNNKFPIIYIESIKHSSKMCHMPYIFSSLLLNFINFVKLFITLPTY